MSIKEIKPENRSENVKKVLSEMTDRSNQFNGIICIAINKDGSQYLVTSDMSLQEKAFLCKFFEAYLIGIFRLANE